MNSNGPTFEEHLRSDRIRTTDGLCVDLHPVDFEELDSLASELEGMAAVAGTLSDALRSPDATRGEDVAHHLERRLDALSDELRTISMRETM
jgi:hypothetical protein